MISDRKFEDTIAQINEVFHSLDERLKEIERNLEELKKPKRTLDKKASV
jgi:prefoldin subunit 5